MIKKWSFKSATFDYGQKKYDQFIPGEEPAWLSFRAIVKPSTSIIEFRKSRYGRLFSSLFNDVVSSTEFWGLSIGKAKSYPTTYSSAVAACSLANSYVSTDP